MQNAAKKYNEYGLACLPVKKDKSPMLPDSWGNGISPAKFSGAYGIGIVCGKVSGGLECFDFDNHFGDAKERIAGFVKQCDFFINHPFVVVKTGGGGYHILYRCNDVSGNKKLARKPLTQNGTVRPDAVIETRGQGGYIVAPPTEGYHVIRGSLEHIPVIHAKVREKMFDIARSFNEWAEVKGEEVESQGRPGDIYNDTDGAIEDMKAALLKAGWVNVRAHLWRRPDKKDGVSATLGKVARNVFYVFTANGHPFESERGYKPFQVVGLLRYGGDFSRFAAELKSEAPAGGDTLSRAKVDLSKPVMRPPIALAIKEVVNFDMRNIRLFTLGNFSAVIGKAKSKKTIFLTMVSSVIINNRLFDAKFKVLLPDNKRAMVYFDTEQGDYDVYSTAKRIAAMAGRYTNFEMFQLREFEPRQRCEMIDKYLQDNPQVGFVVIDGIADLGVAVNDEEEATRVTSLLMRWTKQYNIHIVNVIHQNKMNDFATGHLGSYIMKKAEIILSVTKDAENKARSEVRCDMSRGPDFEPFSFIINEQGIPEFDDTPVGIVVDYNEVPF